HLRKRALIDAGFYNEQIIDAEIPSAAFKVARAMAAREEFSLVFARGQNVIIRTAKSQRRRGLGAMSKQEFQASKQAVLDLVSEIVGVSVEDLLKAQAA